MNAKITSNIIAHIDKISVDNDIKKKFVSRILEGAFTRDENPKSHLCIYFAAYDPIHNEIFLGHHKKSGLWLFNGGHLDTNETLFDGCLREIREEWGVSVTSHIPSPSLLTITQIENPVKQKCKEHFDIWFFFPFDKVEFKVDETALAIEFSEWCWMTIDKSKHLINDAATQKGINKIAQLFCYTERI